MRHDSKESMQKCFMKNVARICFYESAAYSSFYVAKFKS